MNKVSIISEAGQGKPSGAQEESKEVFKANGPEHVEASQKTGISPLYLLHLSVKFNCLHSRKLASLEEEEQPAENVAEAIEEDDSEDEGIEDYKDEGYHAMHIG